MNRPLLYLALLAPLAVHGLITQAAGQPEQPASGAQPSAPAAPTTTINFDSDAAGKLPPGWRAEGTNQKGPVATWQVTNNDKAPSGPNVLGLTSVNHDSGGTYNVCWTDAVKFTDGVIEVKVRANSGNEDQGGGPIWRVKDKDNYLVARYNPLEENFRLYYVKDGSRKQLATAKIAPAIPAGEWFTIRIEQKGNAITCFLNRKKELEATDDHITGEGGGGGVGVWTKADAATSFDDLRIEGGKAAAGAASGAPGAHAGGMAGKHSHVEPPLNWVAKPTPAAPEIDGEIDAAWSSATPLVVTVREAVGAGSPRTVTLRALHTANPPMLYVLAEWDDDTKSDRRDPYIWNPETKAYDRPTRPDDQFALEFPISGEFDVSMLAMGKTFHAAVWHWKAGRGGPIGYVDDKRHIISATPLEKGLEYSFGPHGKVYIQRPMDEGTPAYTVKPKPTAHEGDEVDSFVQQQPSGSVADIRGKATHNGHGWVLEMARRLDTGNADDAVIRADGLNLCAIAILDDELYWHHSVSPLIHLTLGKE